MQWKLLCPAASMNHSVLPSEVVEGAIHKFLIVILFSHSINCVSIFLLRGLLSSGPLAKAHFMLTLFVAVLVGKQYCNAFRC